MSVNVSPRFVDLFRKRLREVRESAQLTQEQLGERINVSGKSISKWELGPALPDVLQLKALCQVLDCSADWLLDTRLSDDMVPSEEGAGLHWRVTHPHVTSLEVNKEIADAIELFRLIARDGLDFEAIQQTRFAGCSDPQLRQLLKLALFSNAVQLVDVERDPAAERALRQKFGGRLRQCIVAKTKLEHAPYLDSTLRTEAVAFLAARDALAFLPRNATVGLSGGSTLARFVDLLPPGSPELRGITWVPLLAPSTVRSTGMSANSVVARLLYKQLGAQGYRLLFVDVEDRVPRSGQLLRFDTGLEGERDVIEIARNASVAFITVGSPEFRYQTTDGHLGLSPLMELLNHMSPSDRERCKGDILLALVDENGQRVGTPEEQAANDALVYSIGTDGLARIARSGTVWIVASRATKAPVIRGALVAGIANSLVIDETVATPLLQSPL